MLAPRRTLALALLLLAGCPAQGGAGPGEAPAAGGRATLFARLGGMDGVRALVDDLTVRLASDERLQHRFAGTDFRRFKAQLVVQLCALAGGPCRYRGRSMSEVHAGLAIGPAEFDAFLEVLNAALIALRAGEPERAELLEILARSRGEVVSAPGGR
jgi:hemoglobin